MVAALASCAIGKTTLSVELDTKVVASGPALERATEAGTKPAPISVIVVSGEPASPPVGEMVLSVGAGLVIAKLTAVEVPPPGGGVTTRTEMLPALASWAAVS